MLRSTTNRHGELRLRFEKRQQQTVMVESYFRTPLQVMRAIPDAADCLCVYLLSPTGGIVQGDSYQITIDAGAATHTLVTTQAATKVYRMPVGSAAQTIRINVGPGAIFEYVPEALILFADADFCQDVMITLQPGALLIWQDVVLGGRVAHGELLNFRHYRSRLMVRDSDGLLLYDSAQICPQDRNLRRLGVLEGYPCWGNWYLLGDLAGHGIDAAAFCEAHHRLHESEPEALFSVSPLHRNGLSARVISGRLDPAYRLFNSLWQHVRSDYLHLPETVLRK